MLKPCNWKKCYNLVEITDDNRGAPCYCVEHLSLYYSENRKRYPRNKYGSLWSRISKSHLYRNPHCQCEDDKCLVCYGQHKSAGTVLASEVDHVVRFSRWNNKVSAHRYLQSLCKRCHSSKTNRETRNLI